ncbi:twin-arginine translocation signal domain-containing protein, partial [Burkholderia lata]|uniref:twin-arginine translocation signal domain-containing protein n=1 Tax=Burkholderia lata (strain ATCC 17760 / DSM 23089 / LMG 22485 / NCIMB 9086 / R18194 / 383) TaxID=482957 RepID=UPI00349FDAB2
MFVRLSIDPDLSSIDTRSCRIVVRMKTPGTSRHDQETADVKDDQDTPAAAEPTPRRQFLKLAGAAVAAAGFGTDALAANTPPAAPVA